MRFRLPILLLIALALPGCPPPVAPLTGAGMDMFAPVNIRFYPLSRFIIPAPASAPATATATSAATIATTGPTPPTLLEARLELTDQFNDPTKSPGTIELELFDQPPLSHKGDLLQSWSLSINTPQENRDHWDHTLRNYIFKLPLSKPLPKRDHVLATVRLTLPNGEILSNEIELPLK